MLNETLPIRLWEQIVSDPRTPHDRRKRIHATLNRAYRKAVVNPETLLTVRQNALFAERLRELRDEYSLTQMRMSELTGVDQAMFCHYLSGRREPNIGTITLICQAFQVSADWLLGLSDVREIIALEGLEGRERRELDEKGRLVIPADFRKRMRLPVVLHAGASRTLELWDLPTWTLKRPDCTPPHRDIPDPDTGRITLPEWFRQHARLYPGNTAYLAGAGHFVRVAWSEQLAFPEMQQ